MRAMLLKRQGEPLQAVDLPIPQPEPNEILIKIQVCALCRTDLHVLDGELKQAKLPLIPGHQIIGTIEERGEKVSAFHKGQRVGVPWLGKSCGLCAFCQSGRENLCDQARFTGYQLDGGFAEYCVADARFCFPIPEEFSDEEAAPLLCAGVIGYRSLCKVGEAKRLGFYGFGAAAHILIQLARSQDRAVYAFTRPGDQAAQNFARKLGAQWAGGSDETPPDLLDAAIIFAPLGELVPLALRSLRKGGILVCGGIHMSDIPSFSYELLWGERMICSVANLTRRDAEDFLALASKLAIKTETHLYPLLKANEALTDLRKGAFTGAAVLKI